MRSPPAVAAVVAFAALTASAAIAAPLTASLTVARAPDAADCPDAHALAAAIEGILQAPGAATASPGDVRADVRFSREDGGARATLELAGAREGRRVLTDTGAACAALGRAVGIALALLLDADEPAPPSRPIAASPVLALAVVATPSPPPERASWYVSLAGGPAFGRGGDASALVSVALDLRVARVVEALASFEYVAPRASATTDGNHVDVSLLAARLRLCRALVGEDAALRIALCAEGGVGQLRGDGHGYLTSATGRLAWLDAGGGIQVSHPFGRRWLAALGGDLTAPLRTYTFSVANRGPVYQSSAVNGELLLGVGARLP